MSQKKKIISIIGSNGYVGLELIRFMVNHPYIELQHLITRNKVGRKISDFWPHLLDVCDLKLNEVDIVQVAQASDFVFVSLPHGESQKIIPKIFQRTNIIDLAGDFRLRDRAVYKKFYSTAHTFSRALKDFVYGLPEMNKEDIGNSHHIANPGCYAITIALALLPLKERMEHVDIFAMTGSSGSGKSLSEKTHHPIRSHNVTSYKIGTHQHLPEVLQTLSMSQSMITMVPTSGPFTRGIHLTAFVDLKEGLSEEEIQTFFAATYAAAPFVRIKESVQLVDVVGSNFCDVSIHVNEGGKKKVVIQAAIDNLAKGAAGNAIQNFNIMCGFDETTGLECLSPVFP